MAKAIIGGTGFYKLAPEYFTQAIIDTPYGPAEIFQGHKEWDDFFFIARHGTDHHLAPHSINYRANIKALQSVGVDRIGASFVVGSLDKAYSPGSLVVLDQFIDLTHGRNATFFDQRNNGVLHTDLTYPFCPVLQQRATSHSLVIGMPIKTSGCYIAINGPRFATAAEIKMQQNFGGNVAGMTCVPEAILARELGIHYLGIAIVTAYEAGIVGEFADTSQIGAIMDTAKPQVISLLASSLHEEFDAGCNCASSQL